MGKGRVFCDRKIQDVEIWAEEKYGVVEWWSGGVVE
jgi:hypothetical protein